LVGPASVVCLLGGAGALALVALTVLLPRLRRAAPPRAWALLGAVVLANWLCYAVVFHGDARYRYVPQAALCAVIGLGLAHARGGPRPGGPDYPGGP
jgi:drug/metabolite transporter superfamily protein YnfA